MPTMRNDVKLGLAVGGILLAVLIVYVLVVPGSQPQGAQLVTTEGTEEPTIAPETIDPAKPEDTGERNPVNPKGSIATGDTAGDSTEGDKLADNDPFDNAQAKADTNAGGWDWNKLLNPADTPELMSPTNVSSGGAGNDAPGDLGTHVPPPAKPEVTTLPPTIDPPAVQPPPVEPPTVPESLAKPSDSASAHQHTVQEGETFSSIAASVYGNSRYYPHIMRANPNVDPSRLKPGMTINLPAESDVKPSGAESAGTTSANGSASGVKQIDSKTEYRVQSGDSLERISIKLYGTRNRIDSIYAANKATIGDDPSRLKVGQVLKLPEAPTITVSAN
jgi:nucleoid-associated protein YgaU